MNWVIDTSALIRLYIPDGPLHAQVEVALNRAANGVDTVWAPQLLLAEVANVLLRKQQRGEISAEEREELLTLMMALPIRYAKHEALILPASIMAERHGLTVYDALFVALAERYGARLMSCDLALEKVALQLGLG